MTSPSFTVKTLLCAVLAALALPLIASAQTSQTIAVPSRVTQAINEADIVTLRGNTHPLAQARFDQGAAADSMPMQRMLLVLKRSANQEAALDSLLEQQQDPTSANYHHWLTPQQFGQQFGPSDQDIQTVMNWLQAHGFTVAGASNGRTVIEFSGTAGQVRQAFHTEIHRYALNGQSHWANSSDPQIPDALSPVVAGVNTLYNFPRQSMHEIVGAFNRSRATGVVTPALGSNLTFPNPCNPTSQPVCNFAVGPADFAEIYNVPNAALVPAPATAYNGNNQTIVIVGESDVNTNDVTAFRTLFGLPAANLTTIVSGPDPGFDPGGAETEADLDIEWAGAVAPNAAIDYVIAQPTEASLGVDLAAQYAVDNNLGSVLSESYGICEFFMGTADNVFYNNLWQQAAAQGITVTASSGDGGSTVCDQNAGTQGAAQYGLSVSGVASTPFNVAVGGTDFNDLNLFTQFWNVIPADTPTVPSALGYIPEMTWNDTCTNQELFALFDATTAEQSCNNSTEKNDGLVGVEGGSGGQSNCTVSDSQNLSTCSGGYAKPSWQTSNGVPADGKRDIPDVSLFASNGFNGSFYIVCEEDLLPQYEQTGTASCDPYATATSFIGVGGTSASTPAFAGIMALVDQATSSRQGNANYILYKLAAQSGGTCASAANPPTNCIFHDVPSGSTIQMPCVSSSPNCTTTLSGDSTGVLTGFASTSGYDLATGLGSVNASNLIRNWISFAASLKPSTTSLTLNGGTTAISITHGQFVSVSVNVAPTQGTGTPTGAVSLVANTGASGTQSVANSALAPGSESATFSTNALPGGASYTVDADYPGDGTFAPSTSNPVTVTVSPESSDTKLSVITYSPTTGQIINANASSVQYGSSYLLRTDVTNPSGSDCVTESTGLQSYACPTGTVSVFSDGIPLLASGLSLNSQAYAESQPIQITGGAHSLTADYSGDSSYTAGSTVLPLTVTPAPTTTTLTTPISSQTVVIGSSISVGGQAISNSFGSYPTGTFTALDGTQPLTGTVTTFGYPAKSTGEVFLNGSIATSLSGPSGPHVVTLKYSGDANYSSSVSSAVTVNAVYPTTMSLAANPNNFVYGANTPVILTATLSTNNPASNAALKPTGTISFRASIDQISGSVSTTVGPDQNGNWSIQTTVTVTPQQSEYFYATYAGDQNYAGSSNLGGTFVSVLIPDFSLAGTSQNLVITAGQTGSTTLTITPLTSYVSTVVLSCTPSFHPNISVPGATCSFSPSTVTLSNSAPATVTLSLATLAPSTTMTAMSPRMRHLALPFGIGPANWISLGALAVLLSLPMFLFRRPARFPRAACPLALIGIFCFIIGCGGGAGANTNGSGGTGTGSSGTGTSGPSPTTTTLSTSSTKFALGSSATLTGKVASSTAMTGLLSFNDASFPFVIGSSSNLASGMAQVQMTGQGSIFPGTHVITAQYQGDSINEPSQSGPLNIVVTGPTTLEVAGQTSTDTHIANIPVTIQ